MRIDIHKLKKTFKKQVVVDLDHLSFEDGIVVVQGRNGTGKTTLLNIIAGLLSPDKGQVTYNGKIFDKSLYKELTLVEQKPVMLNRSVYDNVYYPAKLRNLTSKDVDQQIEHLLKVFELHAHKDKNAKQLSGGEQQKVAIARALMCQPKVLLLDEPTANIDEKSQEEIEQVLLDYVAKGKLIIMVTHDKEQASRLSNQIIQL